jgi:hypothetical protein
MNTTAMAQPICSCFSIRSQSLVFGRIRANPTTSKVRSKGGVVGGDDRFEPGRGVRAETDHLVVRKWGMSKDVHHDPHIVGLFSVSVPAANWR